jgi:hypothetical protein
MPGVPSPKSKFAPFEDSLLRDAVRTHGSADWTVIATFVPGRNARQCRERWNNYVNPHLTQAAWTKADDQLLLEKFAELGSRWQLISGFFVGRSKNAIRNRFLSMRRGARHGHRPAQPQTWPPTPATQDSAAPLADGDPAAQGPLAFLDGAAAWWSDWEGDGPSHSSLF